MLISGVSSVATSLEVQETLRVSRRALEDAQTEVSTGRYADVNLHLGGNVSRNLDWRLALSDATQFIDSNSIANNRADALQSVLNSVNTSANTFISTLAGARNSVNGQALIKANAAQQIQSLQQSLNTTYAGQYLFGGQNMNTAPIKDYEGGAAQSSFDSAFQTYFGFAKTDPQAVNITPAQMTQFLQNDYDTLFQSANWNSVQSNATDQNVKTRIDSSQLVDASANANEQPVKDLMKAMIAVYDAGTGQLNQSTFQTVIDYAMAKTANGVQGLGQIEARVGSAQQAIGSATQKFTSAKDILQKQILATENVDSAQAAVKVNDLMNQLEANYAVTGKISKLSLMNYL